MRLIDADKLLQEIEFEYNLDYGETLIDPRDFADAVCNTPTVDAVPVVRCRECMYAYRIDGPMEEYDCRKISFWGTWLRPEHFCSYGQRRS